MHKSLYGICALTCISIFNNITFAADAINLTNKPFSLFKSIYNKDTSSTFIETQSDIDFNQTKHIHLKQFYLNYPVWGADFILHIPQGNAVSNMNDIMANHFSSKITANGTIYQDLIRDLANRPNYTFSNQQLDLAFQHVLLNYQKAHSLSQPITSKKSHEIIFIDKNKKAHWAYFLSIASTSDQGIPINATFILDAITLTIYQQWDDIKTLTSTTGGGYGGNEKIGKLSYDGMTDHLPILDIQRDDKNKICYLANDTVIVKDANHQENIIHFPCKTPNHTHGNVYWNANHDAVNGAYSPSNDALFIGKIIKDMYEQWYHIPVLSSKGKPMMLNMQVHLKIDNAFWDGQQMTFGDGVELFYPLVSLGVGAHEISHGFTQQHSDLVYYGQSGGINEAFSDMASQAAMYFVNHTNNWQIGDDIIKGKNKALRYMDEPTKDCLDVQPGSECSIDNINHYHDALDVHHSSGVFNKFFYLISTSNTWDTHKAFNVMVKANQHYWTSTSGFVDAACGVLWAARDYHYSAMAVKMAGKQVGIDLSRCG